MVEQREPSQIPNKSMRYLTSRPFVLDTLIAVSRLVQIVFTCVGSGNIYICAARHLYLQTTDDIKHFNVIVGHTRLLQCYSFNYSMLIDCSRMTHVA
jgi:hypothetical protein